MNIDILTENDENYYIELDFNVDILERPLPIGLQKML